MSGQIQWVPSTWHKAAAAFDSAGSAAAATLNELVDSTTDPGACGAAGGLATVDGAVSIMLSAFGSVMRSEVLGNLAEGLDSEAEAMAAVGLSFEAAEDDAVSQAREMWQ